ncbi:MAG: hypothetical protein RLZZ200_2240, partial [Pseudomonadota bacterium]
MIRELHSARGPVLASIGACLSLALGGCGGKTAPAVTGPAPPLETITVGAESAGSALAWDGVVEAVQQATISAQ